MINIVIISLLLLFTIALSAIVFLLLRKQSILNVKITELSVESASLKSSLDTTEKLLLEEKSKNAHLLEENILAQKEISSSAQKLENAKELLEKRIDEEERLKREMKSEFELITNRLFESARQKITDSNSQNLGLILNPLKEDLKTFKNRIEQINVEGERKHTVLAEQIKNLGIINERLGKEADNLVKALKGDNKTAGTWGESILASLLESCGLQNGREFFSQSSYSVKDENTGVKILRPDIVLKLPDNRNVIIDSKVSLLDYDSYCSAESSEAKKEACDKFVKSVRRHINGLAEKKYEEIQDLPNPDFVALFMPIESAYSLLVRSDPKILENAYELKIVLVTPSTLMGMLKIVEHIWQGDKQQRNTLKIAELGGRLYDKINIFLEKFSIIGERSAQLSAAYFDAEKTISSGNGNILVTAEKLRLLGAKTKSKIKSPLLEDGEENSER